ncbi:MAG TPA: DNA internalization-related competence protein ComEC/Rec2 [Gemmatimonadaceae bacterium]|nr:DNA internalization-related competence protein ComEC/Rec2 [Gemmatimonadaceae bacterium]
MPLIAQAVAAFAAGLLAGFGGVPWAGAAAAAALALAAGAPGRRPRLALAALLAAGVLAARADEAHRDACRVRAARVREWRVVLDEAAAPGAYVMGDAESGGCALRAAITVARGRAAAGDAVRVRGDAAVTARGIRIVHAELSPETGGSVLAAWRAASGARIDTLYRADAPLVRALLIADQRAVDPALRDRFAAAGIVHMLSISGLHVAIIAAAVRLLFLALRLRPAAASLATIAVIAAYVAMIGAPPPAVRSGAMLALAALSRVVQRPLAAWGVLAVGGAIPLLLDLRAATDLGWQLSVLGMASLIAAGALVKRRIAPRLPGWAAGATGVAVISTVATLASAPLVAWHFGRVSAVAPLTNVLATPVMAVLQPALFLSLVLGPWPAAAQLVADAAHPLLRAFEFVAAAGGAMPGASIGVAPTLMQALLAGAAAIALLAACAARDPWRPLVGALALCAAALWCPDVLRPPHGLEMHVIDVGQGDAVALRTPAGRWILTDAGRTWPGGDAGRATVVPYLRRYGGRVALFVLTHPHADHVGGAATVLRALHPAAYWDGAFAGTSTPYLGSLAMADSAGVPWHRAHPGDSLVVDGVVLRVLAPDSAWTVELADPNAASVVTMVEYGAVRFLLMGDAEHGEEERLVARYGDGLRAAVLKVGHHGSNTSSTAPFLAAVSPRVAVISVGAGNSYGHPSASVLAALARAGAAVLRTDLEGAVIVRTDGASLEVEAGGARWRVPVPAAGAAGAAPRPCPACSVP